MDTQKQFETELLETMKKLLEMPDEEFLPLLNKAWEEVKDVPNMAIFAPI